VLFPEFVVPHTTAEEHETHRSELTQGGLWGAGFSTDATNVVMWCCEHNLKQGSVGFKQSHPARSYNISVNHRRRMLWSTEGHPSHWNDKTLAHHENFLRDMHDCHISQDIRFQSLSWTSIPGQSDVKSTTHAGAYGHHRRRSCTQAPAKVNRLTIEQRLSDWIESFRKDVECAFGILKGRFRLLKTGIRAEGSVAADRMRHTCCALQNMPFEADGLHAQWEEGHASDHEEEFGNNNPSECQRHTPFAIRRSNDTQLQEFGGRRHEEQSHQRTQIGDRDNNDMDADDADDDIDDGTGMEEVTADGAIIVNSLSHFDFREQLVNHFNMHRQRKMQWPTRNPNTND